MTGLSSSEPLLLYQTRFYTDFFDKLRPKFQSQIARKSLHLTRNPHPGGSRTVLKGYSGLYRERAGDFRIIYNYDDRSVQLLTLRRRNEATYDDLDDLEIRELDGFQGPPGPEKRVGNWEERAMEWAAPVRQAKKRQPLPEPITEALLADLGIPNEYAGVLIPLETGEAICECDSVPQDQLDKLLDHMFPFRSGEPTLPIPVRDTEDLIDEQAAKSTGPIDADDEKSSSGGDGKAGHPPDDNVSRGGQPTPPSPPRVSVSRGAESLVPYSGNTAHGIPHDARYTVKLDDTVALRYTIDTNERALLTTDAHPDLVRLVNRAKRYGNGTEGGSFLINEFRHVLVPTAKGVLYAGTYTRDLEFDCDGELVSPVARPGIRAGDIWPGPHVGVRYTLAAGSEDIRYETEGRVGTKRLHLSDFHSRSGLAGLLDLCRAVKPSGGAMYVNEARELFGPVEGQRGFEHRYIGHLSDHPWFPEPALS